MVFVWRRFVFVSRDTLFSCRLSPLSKIIRFFLSSFVSIFVTALVLFRLFLCFFLSSNCRYQVEFPIGMDSVLHVDWKTSTLTMRHINYIFWCVFFFIVGFFHDPNIKKTNIIHSSSLQRSHTKYARGPKWLIAHWLSSFLYLNFLCLNVRIFCVFSFFFLFFRFLSFSLCV